MTDVRAETSYKLMRARHGRMLGGVAAGLAKASGLDVTVVRVCLGATVLTFGLGVPAYILMWVVLPEESPRRGRLIEPAPEPVARYMRIAIVGVAALSVLNELGGISPFSNPRADVGWGGVIGLILLGAGASVLFSRHRPDKAWMELASPPEASGASWRAPAGDDYYLGDDADEEKPTYVGPFRDVVEPVADAVADALREVRTTMAESRPARPPQRAYEVGDEYDYAYYDDYDLEDPEPPRVAMVTSNGSTGSGAALGFARVVGWIAVIWFTLGAIAVTAAWIFGAFTLTKPVVLLVVSWLVFLAVVNTLLHARFARAIIPALALLLIPVAIASATVRANGGVGHEIVERPADSSTLNYRQAVGRLDLNFGDDEFRRNTTINARVGTGAIFVEVPNDVAVKVNTRTGVGGYEVFGHSSDDPRGSRTFPTFAGCGEGSKTLTLNLRTGAGYIQVHRANGKLTSTCAA